MASILRFSRRYLAKLNPHYSFRTRWGLTIGSIAFVLSILASLIFSHTVSVQVKYYVGQSLTELAYQMTDKVNWRLFECYGDLQIISTLDAIRHPNYSGLQQRTLLDDVAFTTVRHLQQHIFTWNIILGVLFAVLGWLVAMAMTHPIVVLAVAADRICQGNKQAKIPLLRGKDEIASLSKSLIQLVSTLTQQENDLKATNAQLQLELTSRLVAQEMLRQSQETFRQLIAQDITECKQVEETRLALEKEREISELKSRFIAIASHEFRTPLTSILLCCEFLRNHHHKLSDETKERHFQQIKSSVKHLNQVLEDVLIVGRVQAGKLQFNPAPLALVNFCFDVVEQLQFSAGNQYNLNFVSQCSYNATTKNLPLMDEKLLRHILTNLLSNAIKYSPQGGNIQFNLTCDDNSVIFRIQDQGIGIPKEEQAELFTSFYRCSNIGNLPGTGLGLTIVKNAVELHGGQITVESEVGLGTTFTVILPLIIQLQQKKPLRKME